MTGRRQWLRRPPPKTRKAAQLARSDYIAERTQLLAALHAETASEHASVFAILSSEFASKIAAAHSYLKGPALAAALDAIRRDHLAAQRVLSVGAGSERIRVG